MYKRTLTIQVGQRMDSHGRLSVQYLPRPAVALFTPVCPRQKEHADGHRESDLHTRWLTCGRDGIFRGR